MFEGKELRRDLIAEVRTTHALEDDEAKEKAQEHRNINDARQKASDAEDRTNTDAAIVGNVAGGTVGRTLDFLSKELVRLQEERRVHAFAMLAEKQRRIREAEESGKRQREEALRAKQNEIFRQIAGVHHTSVETYLEDILIDSTTHVADEIARTEIRRKAAAIDMVAQQLHDEGKDETEMGALAIAADLVSSFLLPEADRVVVRQKVKQRQRRFLVAAHRELIAGETEAESKVEPRERFSTISPLTSTEVDTVMEENEEDEHAFLRDASNTTKGEDATPTEPEAKVAVAVAVAVAEGEAGEAATTPVAEDGVDKPTDAATEDAAEKPTKPAAEDSAGGADKAAEPVAEGDVENPTTPAADAAEPTEPTEPAAEDAADKPTTPAADAAEPTEPTEPAAEDAAENPTTPAADAAEPTEPTVPAAEDAADKPTTPAADAAEPTEPTEPAAEDAAENPTTPAADVAEPTEPTEPAAEDAADKPTTPAADAAEPTEPTEPAAEDAAENPTTPAADVAEPTEPTEPAAEDAADKPTTPAADAAEPTEPTQPAAEATEEIA